MTYPLERIQGVTTTVSMEQLLGHTTALATATQESGSVVGKLVAA
ncbi:MULTISPECIES: hypothetical protein [Paenibacillus]|nr:hypothetical protein [Paenibacillus massiliensis]